MEIERKFLVSAIPDNLESYNIKEIEQAYISTNPTIRIRKSNSDYILTVKGSGHMSREEFELSINEDQYLSLMKKTETLTVAKTRYEIPIDGGYLAELDIYHGQLEGLMTVEVEFNTVDEALIFKPPSWFSIDVTNDKRYKNTALSINGIPHI